MEDNKVRTVAELVRSIQELHREAQEVKADIDSLQSQFQTGARRPTLRAIKPMTGATLLQRLALNSLEHLELMVEWLKLSDGSRATRLCGIGINFRTSFGLNAACQH